MQFVHIINTPNIQRHILPEISRRGALFKVGLQVLWLCDLNAHFESLYQGFSHQTFLEAVQFYGPNVFVHNEVYYDTRSLYNTPILANLKRRVLIYYSSISLSSHAKLCPIAECDVMSSCNDEHLQNNPACCSSGDKTSLKIKKKKKKSEGMFFKTFQSTAFCSVKEFCN